PLIKGKRRGYPDRPEPRAPELWLCCLGQGADGIAGQAQVDSIGELFDGVCVNRHNPTTDPEEAPDLDLNRLHLTVGSSHYINDIAEILAVGTVCRHASQGYRTL